MVYSSESTWCHQPSGMYSASTVDHIIPSAWIPDLGRRNQRWCTSCAHRELQRRRLAEAWVLVCVRICDVHLAVVGRLGIHWERIQTRARGRWVKRHHLPPKEHDKDVLIRIVVEPRTRRVRAHPQVDLAQREASETLRAALQVGKSRFTGLCLHIPMRKAA